MPQSIILFISNMSIFNFEAQASIKPGNTVFLVFYEKSRRYEIST